ncbi:MAG: hypothetical protein Q7S45_02020 [Candidatus Curtissbacteria bacterium]|nr:hypothetical protein [Candidatus Curtissbacteria bacterium]
MHIHSYKYYVSVLEKKPKASLIQKTLFLFLALVLITGGAASAFSFWQYYKEAPLRTENHYLEVAISGFTSSKNSLSEIIGSFQVAGAKVKAVDILKEATPTPQGYYVSLNDIEKAISQVESTQKSLLEQKNQLSKLEVPDKFQAIRKDLFAYYNGSAILLDGFLADQNFQREILIASGTGFYLPVLTDETLWPNQKPQPIIDYYEAKKRQANITLSDLSRLTVPDGFKTYYDTQIAYLELLVNVASDITKTLSGANETEKDSVPQIEKAYQILQQAKIKNEGLSGQLLSQKLKVFDKKRNLEKFAQVNITQNALQAKLTDLYQNQPQPKTYQIPQTVIKVISNLPAGTKFLQALQTPLAIW